MPAFCYSQNNTDFEEVMITVSEPNMGSVEMQSLISGKRSYLPVKNLFDFLQIKNSSSSAGDEINGFFINPNAAYQISSLKNSINYNNSLVAVSDSDLIFTDNTLFLKSDLFGKIFGLDCNFNFRSLSVNLNSKVELPAVREKRQEQMRQNLSRLKSERKPDTLIGKNFSLFHLGMADWQVTALQDNNGRTNTRASINFGGLIAGGEANIYFNYNSGTPFKWSNQFYNWRYVDNDRAAFKQVSLGRVFSQSTSSLIAPLNGIQISNTPTYYKKSFATYTYSNTTEPNWIVELYVNSVLVNYTKADASGFFSFEVPIIYGTSILKFRYYGPWGEERSSEQNINIPFTFLPENQLEYSITAGILSDDQRSKFSRGNLNYGLTKRVTIGAGVEYLSSAQSGKSMPFVNASVRIGSKMIFSGEHTYGVLSKATINYRLPGNLQFDINYMKYEPGQTAIRLSYLEEKKATITMPIRSKRFNGFSRLVLDQITLPKSKFTSAEFLFGGIVAGVSSNITTYAVLASAQPVIYSKLSMTYRLPKGIRLTPQAQYEYREKTFSMYRTEMEKQIVKNGFLNVSYERNTRSKTNTFLVGLRFNFSFAQTSFSARQTNQTTFFTQTASGGLVYNDKGHYFAANNFTNVGRAGLMIIPFLDFNCNGIRDADEPEVCGLIARVPSGRIDRNSKVAAIRVSGLEAYNKYTIDLDGNSFDNPAWKIHNKVISVVAEPNTFKLIEVPVFVEGEVSGTVYLKEGTLKKGQARMIVNIYSEAKHLVAKTLTEPDGYFSYLGLPPGNYFVSIDEEQLTKTNLEIQNPNLPFTIQSKREGDIFDNAELILSSKAKIIE